MKRTMCVWLPNWPIQRVRAESHEETNRPVVLSGMALTQIGRTGLVEQIARSSAMFMLRSEITRLLADKKRSDARAFAQALRPTTPQDSPAGR